jgi:hypothetical protein
MQIQTFYILKALLWRDILEHHKYLTQRLLDALVWSTCVTFLSQYILPTMGMPTQYGAFMLVGNFALWGLFETNTQVVELLTEHGFLSNKVLLTRTNHGHPLLLFCLQDYS